MTQSENSNNQVQAIIDLFQAEQKRAQKLGRPPKIHEKQWQERLQRNISMLESTLPLSKKIAEARAYDFPKDAIGPESDGLYRAKNQLLEIDIRVDEEGCGVISGDLFRTAPEGRSYIASFRTPPGTRVKRSQMTWLIIAQDEHGAKTTGTLALYKKNPENEEFGGKFFIQNPLHSLPVRTDMAFKAAKHSNSLRTLGLEWEQEEGVADPAAYDFEGQQITIEGVFKDLGFDVSYVGERSKLPAAPNGWGTSQLHTLMQDFAQASLNRRAWELHLLMLSRSTRRGLLGIMFDSKQPLPRQGAAVFASEIRGIPGIEHDRKLIQTTVHELGHALNLAHRFERSVGKADSTSFMNYDWRYKGGGNRDTFWKDFCFCFDKDEKEFLRHAPLPALIPGGAPFHSVNYWADGNGGYTPYVPEVDLPGFTLKLSPPQSGPVFRFAQPVFLHIELSNNSGQDTKVPPMLLDPKSGFLEVLVRRRLQTKNAYAHPLADTTPFIPVMYRCFDVNQENFHLIPNGGTMENNLNLTYGSAGFSFAEPGEYDIIALIGINDRANRRERVVRSQTLRIRIATPKQHEEEKEAMVLFREDVGLYFALGGSDGLSNAYQDLQEVREKRQHRSDEKIDPVVANIIRCAGINSGRSYLRYQDGSFHNRDQDLELAASLLEMLDDFALEAFDIHTAKHTKKLALRHRNALT